jgi:hypothetical protein
MFNEDIVLAKVSHPVPVTGSKLHTLRGSIDSHKGLQADTCRQAHGKVGLSVMSVLENI